MSSSMQKMIIAFVLLFSAAFLFAQEDGYAQQADAEQPDLYYFNVPIERIYYHPRGYYILYRTSNGGIARMCVPYEWMKLSDTRAVYNTVRAGVAPYFSYVTRNGEFYQIRINGSTNRGDSTWGVVGRELPDERFDVETINLAH